MQRTLVYSPQTVNQSGFSLLEAIVALTIFSAVGVVLFGWVNVSLNTAAQMDERMAEARRKEAAVVELMNLDLFAETSGTVVLEQNWQLSWQATPATPRQNNRPLPGGDTGSHDIQLFRVVGQIEPSSQSRQATAPVITTVELVRLMTQ